MSMQPKFQCAVPFTPVTGPRILIRDPAESAMLLKAAAQTLMQLTGEKTANPLRHHIRSSEQFMRCDFHVSMLHQQ